jgi:threonine 3-dehydrogenase
MWAIIKKNKQKGLNLVNNFPKPVPNYREVIIKVLKTSICGTDIHIDSWDEWSKNIVKPPLIIGHEFVGTIIEKGTNVNKNIKIGTLVTGEGHITCGKCKSCKLGKKHFCYNTIGLGYSSKDGAFAEYLSIPEDNIWTLDERIPKEIYSIFDPLGNSVHATLSFNLIGKNVLITGCGPIGCMSIAIAKHVGAKKVIATDVNYYRLKLAEKLGADYVFNPQEESFNLVRNKLNIKDGFEVGLEMSGNKSALNKMINNMCNGGEIALLGILPKKSKINLEKVIFKGITIKGIYGRKIYDNWYTLTNMLNSGLNIKPVITHQMHYKSFQKGIDLMKTGKCGKIILSWD